MLDIFGDKHTHMQQLNIVYYIDFIVKYSVKKSNFAFREAQFGIFNNQHRSCNCFTKESLKPIEQSDKKRIKIYIKVCRHNLINL